MSTARYIEVDSSYRNRLEWPNPAEFEMLISQTGRKDRNNAVDPVSTASIQKRWTSNAFNTTGPAAMVSGTVTVIDGPGFGASGDSRTVITLTATGVNTFQQIENYYNNAVAVVVPAVASGSARIIKYKYLGQTGGADRVQITVTPAFSVLATGDTIEINDPTDLSDTSLPLIFTPYGNEGENSYTDNIVYNETYSITTGIPQYRYVNGYDAQTHIVTVNTSGTTTNSSGPVTNWTVTDVYCIREDPPLVGVLNNNISSLNVCSLPTTFSNAADNYKNSWIRVLNGAAAGDLRLITRYETYTDTASGGSTTTVIFPFGASNQNGYYVGSYIEMLTGAAAGNIRQVISYTVTGTSPNFLRTVTVDAAFTAAVVSGDSFTFRSAYVSEPFSAAVSSGNTIEILPFSFDNMSPFVYSGSQVSQQEMVCYEIQLLNISLPNKTLASGSGSRIAFYPYIYIELTNVSGSNAGMKNTIYSNNPNSTRMVFRATVDDIQNPLLSAFVKVDGDGMVQTLKFKPNDNLKFSVHLSNGELYQTVEPEWYGPLPAKPETQISAIFSIKRL